jgi:(+)-trans-carveol dehydrogenase
MGRVEGKVALVTGAARGQGRSHAVRLAEEGADIVAIDICETNSTSPIPMATPEDLAETVALVEAKDRRIVAAEADIRDYDALKAAVDGAVAELGGLDIVSANAGVIAIAKAIETPEDLWKDTIETNLTGTFHTCKAAAPALIERGGGSIVITASASVDSPILHGAAYVASKAGVVGFAEVLALELAEHSIRVNIVHPGTIPTEMAIGEPIKKLFRPDLENPTEEDMGEVAKTLHLLPIPWLQPQDVSEAVLWLASDEARYVTGAKLAVDAGMILR